ncbi:MAG TPA: EF-hand domain-containing protein [Allosphingosinicella sp.]|nr:EF-hand domain-containing protein [Allosphingosinicella sp.]
MFERLDADNNGQLSREEFAQGRRGARGPGAAGPMAGAGPDGPPPGGPGWRRGRGHSGPGMGRGMGGMRMGGRLFGEAGFITAEQFRTRALARFDRADANRDGTVTVAERQAQRGHRRHGRFGPRPGGPGAPNSAR